jgi:hypothetical protein
MDQPARLAQMLGVSLSCGLQGGAVTQGSNDTVLGTLEGKLCSR